MFRACEAAQLPTTSSGALGLEIKSFGPPSEGPVLAPSLWRNLLKRLFQVEADLTSNSCDWNLELFEALIANAVFLCDADALLHWNSAAEEGAWGGLKTGPPRRHQIQPVEGPVLDPRAKETYLKRGQKVDPLEIKSGPPWRVQFWPLHCGKSVEAFISS